MFAHFRRMLLPLEQDQAASHARKQHITKRTQADGVCFLQRSGQTAFLAYSPSFALVYIPSIEGGREQILCRIGDSAATIEGRNLWPLFEDLKTKRCELVQEADLQQPPLPAMPCIEQISVRLWL